MNSARGFEHRGTFSCADWLQDLAELSKFPSLITVNPKGPQVCLGQCLNASTNIQVFSVTPGVVLHSISGRAVTVTSHYLVTLSFDFLSCIMYVNREKLSCVALDER